VRADGTAALWAVGAHLVAARPGAAAPVRNTVPASTNDGTGADHWVWTGRWLWPHHSEGARLPYCTTTTSQQPVRRRRCAW
jgi:hypothetical protein